jgi:hypothetical protein
MHIIKRPTERAALINTENLKSVHRPTNAKFINTNQWVNSKEYKTYVYDLCLKFCTNARQVLVC